ncbi:hypothetical protein BDR22DRAFT_890124 [Usnea florida]
MDPSNPSQQDSWQSNVYVISTTRVLVAIGGTFLIRSAYHLFQRMRSSGDIASPRVTRAREAVERDIEALALGALGGASMLNSGPMDGINETLDITLPQPAYTPAARSPSR